MRRILDNISPDELAHLREVQAEEECFDDFDNLAETEPQPAPAKVTPIKKRPPATAKTAEEIPWRPVITCMENIAQEAILWLWAGYIALRKLALIEGDPSHGKTWLTLSIAAAVSRGWPLPDPITGRCIQTVVTEPRNVVYLTAEDGLADTVKPRLVNLGADCTHIYVIEGQRQEGKEMEPVTMQDLYVLRQALEQVKPALLIIDPLQGFLGSGVDMHRANETRPVLAGMMRLAEEFNCAVIIVRHLNKSSGGKVSYRGMGSIDFTAAARTVLLVGKDPEDPHRRIVVPTKCNVGAEGVPMAFMLTPEAGFQWAGKVDISAEDLLYQDPGEQDREKSRLNEAADFLLEILADGTRPIKKVKTEAKAADIADATLRRARENLGIKAYKEKDEWYWYIPVSPIEKTVSNMGDIPQTPNKSVLEHVVQINPDEQDDQRELNKVVAEYSGMLFNLINEEDIRG